MSVQSDDGISVSFDTRWAAWIEHGRQRDLAVRRKARVAWLAAAIIGIPVALYSGLPDGAR